jgi:hypothetical protein
VKKKVTAKTSVSAKKNVKANKNATANVKAAAPKKIAVSAGVIAGNKLGGMTPQYPAIAKPGRVQGTVAEGRPTKVKKSVAGRNP